MLRHAPSATKSATETGMRRSEVRQLREVGDVCPRQCAADTPTIGLQSPGQRLKQRALSGPVRADERRQRSGSELPRDILQREDGAAPHVHRVEHDAGDGSFRR